MTDEQAIKNLLHAADLASKTVNGPEYTLLRAALLRAAVLNAADPIRRLLERQTGGEPKFHWRTVPGQPGITEGTHPDPPSIEDMAGILNQPATPQPSADEALLAEAEELERWSQTWIFDTQKEFGIWMKRVRTLIPRLAAALRQAEERIRELEQCKADTQESCKAAMDETCNGVEKHCACVPLLRQRVRQLECDLVLAVRIYRTCYDDIETARQAKETLRHERNEARAEIERKDELFASWQVTTSEQIATVVQQERERLVRAGGSVGMTEYQAEVDLEIEGRIKALTHRAEQALRNTVATAEQHHARIRALEASIPARERAAFMGGAEWADGPPGAGFVYAGDEAARRYPDLPKEPTGV